jgi:hypothetical protein
MKERPILFTGAMVRALLDGSKTQTRRIMKPQPEVRPGSEGKHWWPATSFQSMLTIQDCALPGYEGIAGEACPHGGRGDRLWVREATEIDEQTSDKVILSRYSADRAPVLLAGCADVEFNGTVAHWDYSRRTRPSIHMPRWACRIELEITDVCVERLQDISQADCIAEGAPGGHGSIPGYNYSATPYEHYKHIWESINGAGSWDTNPWVWVIGFRRIN